jgi:hypothetical protein
MHRAMLQSEPVHLAARLAPNHLVALVDDIKNFFRHDKLKIGSQHVIWWN